MQKPGSDCAEEKSPSQARPTLDRKKGQARGLKRGALRSESEQAGRYRVPVIRLVSEPIYSLADQASEIRRRIDEEGVSFADRDYQHQKARRNFSVVLAV
jgi:predicted double-glycine peptidase